MDHGLSIVASALFDNRLCKAYLFVCLALPDLPDPD